MNDLLQVIILGIIEGITEFLPVSSTGHLLVAEDLWLGQRSDMFNVVIQAGAILAIILIYWNKIFSLIRHIDNPAVRVELPPVVNAPQAPVLIAAVEKRCLPMWTKSLKLQKWNCRVLAGITAMAAA